MSIWNTIGNYFFPGLYWKGRSEGWFACENMVFGRIKKYYPEIYDEMVINILQ